jgi:glycosyltransferase involved in cell wall biosynthesis
MEIIHLILGKANPERMNGINRVVYQLATHQHKHERNVSVWGITRDLTHNYTERSFTTKLFPASRNPFGVSRELREALQKMQGRTDVVFHLHGGWVPVYATLVSLFRRYKLRYVLTGHGAYNTVAMLRSKWVKRIYFQLFEKPLLDGARRIHSIGQTEVEGLSKFYPNTKNVQIPYGFESTVEHAPSATKEDGFIIGFVGRLDIWTKGLDLLLQSFQHFHKENLHARLWIIGDGAGRAELEKRIATMNVQGVVLWGSKFGVEKDDLLSRMHVFVHPSRNEGLPASVLEAAVMGIPAIVSKPTNVAETIAQYDAGLVLPENTSAHLEQALVRMHMCVQHRRDQMGHNARRMVGEAFAWERLLPAYDTLYREESVVQNLN